MYAFIVKRIIQSVVVVLGVTLIVFVMLQLIPLGPVRGILGPKATPQQVEAFTVAHGYDKPWPIQYLHFLGRLSTGDLGRSYTYNESVASLIGRTLPKSALLVGLSYVVSLTIAIPLGLVQAIKRNSVFDHVATVFSFVTYSIPEFWLGVLLISVFAIKHPLLPASAPSGSTVGEVLQNPAGLVLPVATLGLIQIALFSRFMRSQGIEVLVQDYIRTARSKGRSNLGVLRRHVLRNAIMPIITIVGMSFPRALAGAILVETVFNYPGMGLLFWKAATTNDYSILLGATVVVGTLTILGNLVADVLYGFVDPRIRVR
jgi:peptide/nickel transport system permease protein